MDFMFYSIIAMAGYFSTYNLTSHIVLERPPIKEGSIDYPIVISMVSIIIVLFVAVPLNFNPFRN